MTPVSQRRFTSPLDPSRTPTRRDIPAVTATRCSSAPLEDTIPTPLLPPPPGPQPARASIADTDVAVPDDWPLELLLQTVPRLRRSRDELAEAPIDHRDCFILGLVDGETSVQGLVDAAGIPHDDVLRALQRLRRLGLIRLS
jgi:hypothetical protein